MAGEIGGTDVSLLGNGASLEVKTFSWKRSQPAIDRANATTGGEPRNAAGQRTGQVTASGPRSATTQLAAKGIVCGALVTFRVRATPNLFVDVVARVSEEDVSCDIEKGADWSITAQQYGAVSIVGL